MPNIASAVVVGLFRAIRDGISPGPNDPTGFLDRFIRVIGGLIVLGTLATGLILALAEVLKNTP
jgi:hypothetical protein